MHPLVIIGAGPAGLSAAVHAAERGLDPLILEASPQLAATIHHYPKRKRVMAEPTRLPLRSTLAFTARTREDLLVEWQQAVAERTITVRTQASVTGINGEQGHFRITLAAGEVVEAGQIILAIGLQGNLRTLGVPGEDLPGVRYQLDDPDAYHDQTIVVVGGGDAGIENALALAENNQVILLNRQEEFASCGEANFTLLRQAVSAGRLETRLGTSITRIEPNHDSPFPYALWLSTPHGPERVACHHIIARLGATPPRALLEGFGIRFAGSERTVLPVLSAQYESTVPGLYIIGALAGFPLIKQALNQGYEVVEAILGNPVEPADEGLLLEKLTCLPPPHGSSVAAGFDLIRQQVPIFASLNALQLRELVLESQFHAPATGEVLFKQNDYSNSFFAIVQGEVVIQVEKEGAATRFTLPTGQFFGEIGLLSGRRRSGTAAAGLACILIETPRRIMLRLIDNAPEVRRMLDEVSLKRIVRNGFGRSLPESVLDHLVQEATVRHFAAGETLFNEGDAADALYMIRRGSVTVSHRTGGQERVLAYVAAGSYVGEMALVLDQPRTATVRAAAATETVMLAASRFNAALADNPGMRSEVSGRYLERLRRNASLDAARNGELVSFLLEQGGGEATDILLIDNTRCTRCNHCERACADVHQGASRLKRGAGRAHAWLHVPASCRHCEHPRCMQDCPPDAIHRSAHGEVFIGASCIGCGRCQQNCPYGVIQMVTEMARAEQSFWQRLFASPAQYLPAVGDDAQEKKAVKCDMCRGIIGGAACVRACPTGAAFRVTPEEFLELAGG